jgi:hypothetical protein
VVGLAADDRPEARDAVVAPRLGRQLRRERQLERAGDVEDLGLPAPASANAACAPGDEALGQVLVEAATAIANVTSVAAESPSRPRVVLVLEWMSCSSRFRPWWCSVWPIRSAFARR